jgi:hypothetical protein
MDRVGLETHGYLSRTLMVVKNQLIGGKRKTPSLMSMEEV